MNDFGTTPFLGMYVGLTAPSAGLPPLLGEPTPKPKPKPQGKKRQAEDGEKKQPKRRKDVDEEDEEGGAARKKRGKTDPAVKSRLLKLENEKQLLLTKEKWRDRVLAMNHEVSESVSAAEQFAQTESLPVDMKLQLVS